MARIDLARRAQIGRDRRARTRSQLIDAARALYAQSPIEAVTVDDVVAEAAVAKGTFYVHFASLGELQAAVADELAQDFDELLQPRRLAIQDPVERIAAGCAAFIGEALRNPAWGALVARGAVSMPVVARGARARLSEDLRRAAAGGRLGDVAPELAFEFAVGIVLQAMQSAAEGRIVPAQAPGVIAGILRAIGVTHDEARDIALRVGSPDRHGRGEPPPASP
ncbi:MAG: TetR/AcrR family transcriptional regulator [Xanthobacteraceae bacterium]